MRVNYQRLLRTPLELRLKIVREYLMGESSRKVLSFRYQVKLGTISQWVHRYGNTEKFVYLPQLHKDIAKLARWLWIGWGILLMLYHGKGHFLCTALRTYRG